MRRAEGIQDPQFTLSATRTQNAVRLGQAKISLLASADGAEVLTVLANGNVGIGVLQPESRLCIEKDGAIELGVGSNPQKYAHAGKIAYQRFSDGLDIAGAGPDDKSRKIVFHAEKESKVTGPVRIDGQLDVSGDIRQLDVPGYGPPGVLRRFAFAFVGEGNAGKDRKEILYRAPNPHYCGIQGVAHYVFHMRGEAEHQSYPPAAGRFYFIAVGNQKNGDNQHPDYHYAVMGDTGGMISPRWDGSDLCITVPQWYDGFVELVANESFPKER